MQNLRSGFDGRHCREIRYFEIYRNSLAGCSIISWANKRAMTFLRTVIALYLFV